MELAQEKGASSWFSALPLEEHGFALHKGGFRDAICLHYLWDLPRTPEHCACGQKFGVNHAMCCPKGDFPTLRHNEVRDLTADLLTDICGDVEREPLLQPVTGEQLNRSTNRQMDARLDVRARGFWERGQSAFFDVRLSHQATVVPLSPPSIVDTKMQRSENTLTVCYRLNRAPSHLWSSRQQEAWQEKRLFSIRDLPTSSPQSKENITPPSWDGYDAD